ncbi:MAG: lysine decarboxylase, partial [Leptolyngbyaceae cyanobacterium RM2_2_21]|nr:lysine decarboxylase [Leptolyngbyaceae cyanobacterium RM2_2_21]
ADIAQLVAAFRQLTAQTRSQPVVSIRPLPAYTPTPLLSPRQAFFAPAQTVSAAAAIGQISAELICPYPPGIPLVFPGEVIEPAAIAYLQAILKEGGVVTGCADLSLQTLKVVKA